MTNIGLGRHSLLISTVATMLLGTAGACSTRGLPTFEVFRGSGGHPAGTGGTGTIGTGTIDMGTGGIDFSSCSFSGSGGHSGGLTGIDGLKATAGAISFSAPQLLPTPLVTPEAVVVAADLNGDGRPDLIYSTGTDLVGVLVNEGDKHFTAALYQAVHHVNTLATGDVDGDGDLDIVTPGVSVLINDGKGKFALPVSYHAAGQSSAVTVADLNGDGRLDIASANDRADDGNGNGDVTVLMNAGGAVFASPVHYDAGVIPGTVTAGDLDGDGYSDLIVGTQCGFNILRNTGTGTFAPPLRRDREMIFPLVSLADLNGDGRKDLVVSDRIGWKVNVLMNNAAQGLSPSVTYQVAGVVDVGVGDFNDDGRPDLVTSNTRFNTVSLLLNGATGFGTPLNYDLSFSGSGIAVADFDGDGASDIALGSGDSTGGVRILFNTSP